MNANGSDDRLDANELLGQLLSEVTALAIRLRHPSHRQRGPGAIPAAALAMMRLLSSDGPMTVPQIARLKATSRQNIQIIVNRLSKAGYIQLSQNPAHKRSDLVSLTPQGAEALSHTADSRIFGSIAAGCNKNELAPAIDLLKKIRAAMSPDPTTIAPSRAPVKPSASREVQKPEGSSADEELPVNLL